MEFPSDAVAVAAREIAHAQDLAAHGHTPPVKELTRLRDSLNAAAELIQEYRDSLTK